MFFLNRVTKFALQKRANLTAGAVFFEAPGRKPTEAVETLFVEADKLSGAEDYKGALKMIDRALELARETQDSVGEVRAHRGRAIFFERLKRTGEAVTEWRETAVGCERVGDGPGRIEALGNSGRLLLANNPEEANALLAQTLSLSGEEIQRPLAAAEVLIGLAKLIYEQGTLDWPKKMSQAAFEIGRRSAPDSIVVADSLTDLGVIAHDQGDVKAAKNYHQLALTIREKLAPNSLAVAESLNNLSIVAQDQGDLKAAADYDLRALAIQDKLAPNSLDVARSLTNLGIVARDQGDLRAAADYYQRALTIHEELAPNSWRVATSLTNLGGVAYDQGDLKAAADYYHRALTVSEESAPNSLGVALNLTSLGNVARAQGNLKAATDYHLRALTMYEKLAPNSPAVAGILNNLGIVADDRQDPEAAAEYFRQGLAIEEKVAPNSLGVARNLNNLGIVAREQGDLKAAADYHQRALAIREKLAPNSLSVAESLANLGIVAHEQGDLKAAADYHQHALAIQEKLAPNSLDVAGTLNNLALVARDSGHLDWAESLSSRCWRIVQQQAEVVTSDEARQAFGSSTQRYVGVLLGIQLDRREPEAAFVTLEEGRAQALTRLLFERREVLTRASGDLWPRHQKALGKLHHAEEALGKAERMLHDRSGEAEQQREHAGEAYQQARNEADQLWSEIQKREPRAFVPTMNPAEAAKTLGATAVFVAFSLQSDRAYAFALDGKSARILANTLQLSPARALGSADLGVEGVRDLGVRALGFWLQSAAPAAPGSTASKAAQSKLAAEGRELFNLLFPGDIGEAVLKSKRLIISPDGPLWRLPFAALVTDVDAKGNPHFLGEHVAISYTPSLSLFARLKKEAPQLKKGQRPETLVLGDPHFDRRVERDAAEPEADRIWAGLYTRENPPRRLEETQKEAEVIAGLYGIAPVMWDQATEAKLRKRIDRADVIHLATHGSFQTALPMSSGVVLTPPAKEPAIGETNNDGALQAWEIFSQLKLRAELVVLSACDTARGDEMMRGEGIVGLTRALEYAGARSIVATQWSVAAGESTAKLMEEFHRNLRNGDAKDEALRDAMTTVRKKYKHPFFWAPFILLGDPDNPNLGRN